MSLIKKLISVRNDINSATFGETMYRTWDMVLRKTGLQKSIFPAGWMNDKEVLYAFGNRFSTKVDLCNYLRERNCPNFFFSWRDSERYQRILKEHFGGQQEEILLQNANRILEHRFFLMGKEMQFGNQINWHVSDNHDHPWPLVHWSQLNIGGADGYGDIKPIWELNRHQHFFTLGRAYWVTGENKYAEEYINQVNSWFEQNPVEMGINWQSNLEIALRSISWVWALNFFLPVLDDDTLFNVIRVLIHCGKHLNRHMAYSWYCMHNNHLIGDAAGLAIISTVLPELNESTYWKKKALSILYNELPKQIFHDGVSSEQSLGYHRFVLEFYLQVLLLQKYNGEKVPKYAWDYLQRMTEFILWAIKPDGRAPLLGDGDDGRAYRLSDDHPWDFRNILSTGTVLFKRADFKRAIGSLNEETFWLLGAEALDIWTADCPTKISDNAKLFPAGGVGIVRTGWEPQDQYLLLRCGPHSKHHSHADQLHIEISGYGQELLIDSGTYTYNGDSHWRNFFRSTYAHNTVVIDGESQAIPYRTFRWLKPWKAFPLDMMASDSAVWINSGHTGYHRLADPVTHKRGILVVSPYYLVFDHFTANKEHKYETLFHLPPGKVKLWKQNSFVYETPGGVALLLCPLSTDYCATLVSRQTEPNIQGWVSKQYGMKEPSSTIEYITNKKEEWIAGYLVYPLPNLKAIFNIEETLSSKTACDIAVTLRHQDCCDRVLIQARTNDQDYEEIMTNSKIVFLREKRDIATVYTVEGSYLELKSNIMLTSQNKWQWLEAKVEGDRVILAGSAQGPIRVSGRKVQQVIINQDGKVQKDGNTWVVHYF